MTYLALLLVPLYAVADRMVGGAGKRSVAFGAVLLASAGIAWLTGLWPLLIMAPVWIAVRSLPFKGAFGSTTPHGAQIAATLFRNLLPALATVPFLADGLFDADWLHLAMAQILFALIATVLGLVYAAITDEHIRKGEPGGVENSFIELARGAAYGVALAAWALLS